MIHGQETTAYSVRRRDSGDGGSDVSNGGGADRLRIGGVTDRGGGDKQTSAVIVESIYR